MFVYPTIKESPIVGLSGMGGGSSSLVVSKPIELIKKPFDWALSFDGGSATDGYQSQSEQDMMASSGSPLNGWHNDGGLNGGGCYEASSGGTHSNHWFFPSSDSVAGNPINGQVEDFDQWAMSCWIKTTSTGQAGSYQAYESICGDGTNGVYGGFGIDGGKVSLAYAGSDWTSTSSVNTGNWTHIGIIIENGNKAKIYVAGELDATHSNISFGALYFKEFCGGYNYGNEKPAAMDCPIIWIDRGLTDDDIKNAYTAGDFGNTLS